MRIRTKRAYDAPAGNDGYRVLVDRVWPRGVKREAADLDGWMRDIAPTVRLRKWFGHDPRKWDEFRKRYFKELAGRKQLVDVLLHKAAGKTVTLVYAAKDEEHNNAVALKEYLDRRAR